MNNIEIKSEKEVMEEKEVVEKINSNGIDIY